MQFQVPQFIETEDKIVGPLSLRQFGYVGGAGAISFVLFFLVATWLWAVFTMILAGLAVALAFVKINGRSFVSVLISAFFFYWKPQTYVWQPDAPELKKTPETMAAVTGGGTTINNIVSGLMLKNTWKSLLSGTKGKKPEQSGRYQIYERTGGERNAARRVDYR